MRLRIIQDSTLFIPGLFSYSHMDFEVDRNTNGTGDPSLAEMAIKALRILAKNPEGYFLFVEGKQSKILPFKHFSGTFSL